MAGRGREGREGSGVSTGGPGGLEGLPGGQGWVLRLLRRAGWGQEVLLEGREDRKSLPESWEGLGGPGESGDLQEKREGSRVPFGKTGGVGRAGRVWEDLPDGRERLRYPSEKGRRSWEPFWRAGMGREALPERREWLGGPGEVGRPSWRAGRGREALLEGREGSGRLSKEVGWVRRAGRGWEALPDGWEGWEVLP